MAKKYKGKTSEEKQEQVNSLLSKANEGIKAVFESSRYKEYLKTMSKFHSYSPRNIMLILQQKPEASHVAGYAKWKKDFNRQVKRGEHGIQIIGFTPKTIKVEGEKRDEYGKLVRGNNGEPIKEVIVKQIPSFMPMYVFDVSQTDGEPLPSLVNELSGSVDGYSTLMTALKDISPFPIEYESITSGSKGYCNFYDKRIAIKEGMSQTQTIKTAIHEITHAYLHAADYDNTNAAPSTDSRTKEVEAESVAFVVAAHYDIDTSDYSFPYLAAWSSDKDLPELHSSLDKIHKQSAAMLDKIDNRLTELENEKSLSGKYSNIPDVAMQKDYESNDHMHSPSAIKAATEYGISVEQYTASGLKAPSNRNIAIYQMKDDNSTYGLRYENLEHLKDLYGNKITPDLNMYDKVYSSPMKDGETLSSLYRNFNIDQPADYYARSLSVSDIIAVEYQDTWTANYINSDGFVSLPNVADQIKAAEAARYDEFLNSVKFDNDIDADREKTRPQLGFNDNTTKQPKEKKSLSELIASAKEAAAARNAEISKEKVQARGASVHEMEDF